MSIFGPSPKKPHVPPIGTDDIFLGQLEYESHLAKASVWLHKLIIHRIRDIDAKLCPISKLLDQEDGRLCTRLRYYCRKIKEYPPHKAPPDIVKRDHRAAKILLKRLEELLENPEHVLEARRHVNALECLATSSPDGKLSPEEYARSIDKTRDDIIDAFGKIGADFKKQERGGKKEVGELIQDVHKTVKDGNARIERKLVTMQKTVNGEHIKVNEKSRANTKRVKDALSRYYKLVKDGTKERMATTDACRETESKMGLGDYKSFNAFRGAVAREIAERKRRYGDRAASVSLDE